MVAQVWIKWPQHRYGSAQAVHRMCLGRHHREHVEHTAWHRTLLRQLPGETAELLHGRQFSVEQQPGDFFKARMGAELVNVITAIEQASIGIHPADGGFTSDDPFEAW